VVLTLSPLPNDSSIEVVARLSPRLLPHSISGPVSDDDPRTIVALRQGLHFPTTFHPELTADDQFHEYFVKECVLP
ncbi:hypothetical protein JOM56_015219, partial [Amanita muscaria]